MELFYQNTYRDLSMGSSSTKLLITKPACVYYNSYAHINGGASLYIYALEDFKFTNLDVDAVYRSNTKELDISGCKIKFIRPEDKKVINTTGYVEGVAGTFEKIGKCKKKGRIMKHEPLKNPICIINGKFYSFDDAIVFMNENKIDLQNYYNNQNYKIQLSKYKDSKISCEIITPRGHNYHIVTKIDGEVKKSYVYGPYLYHKAVWATKKDTAEN
jgi:hypothetical protein